MDNLYITDGTFHHPISRATFWRYEGVTREKLIGTTGSDGKILLSQLIGETFRISAPGYIFQDFRNFSFDSSTRTDLSLTKIHSGFYSGYLPEKSQALWHNSATGEFLLFRDNGIFIENYFSSESNQFQYTGVAQIDSLDGWVTTNIRNPDFLPEGRGVPKNIGEYEAFRFTEIGKMRARRVDQTDVTFEIFT